MTEELPRTDPPRPRVLASDLDGTLIPLPDHDDNVRDLDHLRERIVAANVTLVFVTGRHIASIREAIDEHALPRPHWVIGDVGTSLYEPNGEEEWRPVSAYAEHLSGIVADLPIAELRRGLDGFEGLRIQEEFKLGPFKLSYYVDARRLAERLDHVRGWLEERGAPYSSIGSVDPLGGHGLIDLLPRDVSKAYALEWWAEHAGHDERDIVFAGDSGNDLAAFEAGYRTIVVGNADRTLAQQVVAHHERSGWTDRLHLPEERATSGVLAGARRFGLLPED